MASNTYNMNTWGAKRIFGDTHANLITDALLQITANNTWILSSGRQTNYGIKYVYDSSTDHDKIEFYGGYQVNSADAPTAWVQLDTGDVYILGQVGINHAPDTYQLYVDGTSYFDDDITVEGNVVPNQTNTYTLGTSSLRWSKLYIGTADSYGSTTQPIYWNAGVPGILGTIGGQYEPVWVDDGTVTAITAGTTAQFYRGDKSWSNVLTGDISLGSREVTSGPSSITYSNRITIVPYFHTGGPWYIKSGDDSSNAYLALYYGSSNLIQTKHNGNIEITSPATDSVGVIHVVDTRTDANWHYPFLGTCASLAANGNMYICIGKSASTGNAAGLRYQWAGASSNSNLMGFEFYGQGTKLWAYANGDGGVSAQWSCNWLRVINNSSNNSDDATVYIECKTANDWGLKINKGGTAYGIYVDALDKDPAIQTNGYIRGRCIWANQGSNGERQVGVDSGTSGTLYLWSNTTDKGLYSSTGYKTGYIIRVTSSAVTFYGNCTGNAATATTATAATYASSYLANRGSISGSTHAAALQAYFNSYKASEPRNALVAHYSSAYGNGSMCFGYFLSGYDSGPYGGFFVAHYNQCYYVGIQAGTYTQYKIWRQGDAVTGAVWNDYAEYRISNCTEPGYCVFENGDDTLSKTTRRLQHFAGIISDTWGFAQGETEKAKTPIAVSGRVLAYTYRDRNEYKPGDCVCTAPNGTVDIMSKDEIMLHPDKIVGTVSCVPDYEEWGGGPAADRPSVKVNGRIWIKVR